MSLKWMMKTNIITGYYNIYVNQKKANLLK